MELFSLPSEAEAQAFIEGDLSHVNFPPLCEYPAAETAGYSRKRREALEG